MYNEFRNNTNGHWAGALSKWPLGRCVEQMRAFYESEQLNPEGFQKSGGRSKGYNVSLFNLFVAWALWVRDVILFAVVLLDNNRINVLPTENMSRMSYLVEAF